MAKRKEKVVPIRDVSPLLPKNDLQREYINAIKYNKIVCGTGVAGTGKTYIAARMAAEMLQSGDVYKIIITRPNEIEGTRSIGLLPGTLEEKMTPVLAPVLSVLEEALGKSHLEYLIKKNRVEFLPLEYIKGRTIDDAFLIVDEAEDITKDILKVLLLRTGENCKIVIDGDVAQKAIKGDSGLRALMDLNKKVHLPIYFIDFDSWEEHCVRSEEVKYMGAVFDEYGF